MTKREWDGKLWKSKSMMKACLFHLNPGIHPIKAFRAWKSAGTSREMQKKYGDVIEWGERKLSRQNFIDNELAKMHRCLSWKTDTKMAWRMLKSAIEVWSEPAAHWNVSNRTA